MRYFKDGRIKDRFLALKEVENTTSDGIFNGVKEVLISNNIKLSNLIGFAADNAAVMQGNISGVQAKFKEELLIFLFWVALAIL